MRCEQYTSRRARTRSYTRINKQSHDPMATSRPVQRLSSYVGATEPAVKPQKRVGFSTAIPEDHLAVLKYHVGSYAPIILALSAIVCDCYEALRPTAGFAHASSTMRLSSLALIFILSLDEGFIGEHGLVQKHRWSKIRVVLASFLLVAIVAGVSVHEALASTRTAEAVLCLCVLVIGVVLVVVGKGSIWTEGVFERKMRVSDPMLTSTFALLLYVGTCLMRSGFHMCRSTLSQALNPDYGLYENQVSLRRLCVACNGWAAASVAVCGTVLFLCSASCLFVINNRVHTEDLLLVTHMDINSLLRLCVGIYAAGLVSSFMALADCVSNTESTYDHETCTIGPTASKTTPECPLQLIEFRRSGLAQHSIGTNTLAFIAIVMVSLRIEKDSAFLQGFRGVVMRSGVIASCILITALSLGRIFVAEWHTDWFIELSFAVVLFGTALTSFPSSNPFAAIIVYIGLAIDYVYYCDVEGHCRSFRYLTNTSNAIMGIFFVLIIVLDIVAMVVQRCNSQFARVIRAGTGLLGWSGLSLALMLALLVTAAMAAYDGSNIDEAFVRLDSLLNAGLGEQHSVIRFLLWHYAPLIAWASLRQSTVIFHQELIDSHFEHARDSVDTQSANFHTMLEYPWDSHFVLLRSTHVAIYRLAAWVAGAGIAGITWVLYRAIGASDATRTPAAYPMSQIGMMIVTVLPPWLASAI